MQDSKQPQLKRELGPVTAILIVMNMVIGSGVFFKLSSIIDIMQSPGQALIVLLIAGVVTLMGGLSVAELTASIPQTGGIVIWLEEAFGPLIGFLCGWNFVLIAFPAMIASYVTAFGDLLVSFFALPASWGLPISLGTMVLVTIINAIGTKYSGIITNLATVGKLLPIFIIIILGLWRGTVPLDQALSLESYAGASPSLATLGTALLGSMFLYEGWLQAGVVSGDMKNPERDMPRALTFGITGLVILYGLLFLAYTKVLPAEMLAQSSHPASDVAQALLGPLGGQLITVGILISVFGAMSQYIFAAARIPYSMGQRRQLPGAKIWGRLHPKTSTPVAAHLLIGVLIVFYSLTDSYDYLTDVTTFSMWIFYTLTFLAVIRLRRKHPDLKRPVKVPFYPILPLIATASGLYIIISTLVGSPKVALTALGFLVLGLPIYYYYRPHMVPIQLEIKD